MASTMSDSVTSMPVHSFISLIRYSLAGVLLGVLSGGGPERSGGGDVLMASERARSGRA